MKRAIIFYNGDLSNLKTVIQYLLPSDYIIGVDGGAKYALEYKIKLDVVIGDFDSLSKQDQKKIAEKQISFKTYKKEKDETDSELALRYAIKKGYKTILLFGILGARIDHVLTNIFSLDYLLNADANVRIIEGNQEIQLIRNKIKLTGKKGDLVSLLPFKGDAQKVTTNNLKYPLKNENLLFGYSRGISNEFIKETAEISIEQGLLLVIHTRV